MKREIKFRVWDVVQKKFVTSKTDIIRVSEVEDREVFFSEYYLGLDGSLRYLNYDCLDQETPDRIVQQYTDCEDGVGNEIFEGDIVDYRGNKGIVVSIAGMFVLDYDDQSDSGPIGYMLVEDMEVVGHMYES